MNWRYMCEREAAMVITCRYCGKQTIDGHDCPERRRALLAEARDLGEIDAAANEPTNEDAAGED